MSAVAPRLVLASASPRREMLLRDAGFIFTIDPADIDEHKHPPGLSPGEFVEFLASTKARAVAERNPGCAVLGADTVVAAGGEVLGKPEDEADARRMLERLSGSTHLVTTGVAVVAPGSLDVRQLCVESAVQMRRLTPLQITDYLFTGEWMGKAGGYGLQDPDPFVTCISGSESNIVGLPVEETTVLLASVGVRPAFPGRPGSPK